MKYDEKITESKIVETFTFDANDTCIIAETKESVKLNGTFTITKKLYDSLDTLTTRRFLLPGDDVLNIFDTTIEVDGKIKFKSTPKFESDLHTDSNYKNIMSNEIVLKRDVVFNVDVFGDNFILHLLDCINENHNINFGLYHLEYMCNQ